MHADILLLFQMNNIIFLASALNTHFYILFFNATYFRILMFVLIIAMAWQPCTFMSLLIWSANVKQWMNCSWQQLCETCKSKTKTCNVNAWFWHYLSVKTWN